MLLGITGTVEVTLDDGGQFPASSIIGELDGAESELLYGKCLDSELGNLGINGRTIQFAYDAGKIIESLQGSSELRLEPQLCDANVQLGFHGQLPIRRSTLSSLWRSTSDLELVFTLSGSSATLREIRPWWCRCYRPISIPIRRFFWCWTTSSRSGEAHAPSFLNCVAWSTTRGVFSSRA